MRAVPLSVALALAACGTSPLEEAPQTDEAHIENLPADEDSAPSLGAGDATTTSNGQETNGTASGVIGDARGLVFLSCVVSGSEFEVKVISPDSGDVVATTEFVGRPELRPRFGCSNRIGSLDPTLTRMAVDITGLPNGSSHVGFIDAIGNLTDVTEGFGSSGFTTAPQHSNALFGMSGELLFVDNATEEILSVDPMRPETPEVRGTPGPDGFTVDEHGNVSQLSGSKVPSYTNPSGDVAVFSTGGDDLGLRRRGSERSVYVPIGSDRCLPAAWLDDYRLLCKGLSQQSQFTTAMLTFTSDFSSGSLQPLLPPTDRTIDGAVFSPDGSQYAFVSTQGEVKSIFVAPVSGGGEPAEILIREGGDWLLGWR